MVRLSLISLIFSLFAGLATASAEGLELRTTTRMLSDPLGYLFEGQAEVSSLLGAGTDPHTYQPTRKDVRSLIEADAVAFHGLLFEAQLLDLMKQLDRRLVVVGAEAFQDNSDLLFAEGVETAPLTVETAPAGKACDIAEGSITCVWSVQVSL